MPYDQGKTTALVESYVAELAEVSTGQQDEVIRELLGRAVGRLHMLCATVLYQRYPRLTQAPLNLQTEELLSSVVERLIKAMKTARPTGVRQFFSLANQHMRWELNDLARRLDSQYPDVRLMESLVIAPESSGSELSQTARQMLEAIDRLPEEEREVFSLVRIQDITQVEAAEILGVSVKTVQRRLSRSVLMLTQMLGGIGSNANDNT